jgi:uncharacterized protein (DUF1778 family)
MTKRTGQKIERKAVAAYRATPATQALIKRAAAIASVKPSVYVGRVAEERARQDVAESERAEARRRLGAMLDAMQARPATLTEKEAADLAREAVASARARR